MNFKSILTSKLILGSSLVFVLFSTSASAGDAQRWEGLYGGLSITKTRAEGEATSLGPTATWETPGTKLDFNGLDDTALGGQIGYQAVITGNLLIGIEFSINKADESDLVQSPTVAWHNDILSMDNYQSLSGRIGYASSQWLFYGKAGYTRVDVDYEMDDVAFPVNYYFLDETLSGWNAGIGAEYAFNKNLSVGLDYTRIELDSESGVGDQVPAGTDAFKLSGEADTYSLRLNYKFF